MLFRSFARSLLRRPQPPRRAVSAAPCAMADAHLITEPAAIAAIARDARRVAVIGIRPARDAAGRALADRPAHFVAAALAADGVDVVPCPTAPVPEADEFFGAKPVTLAGLKDLPPVDVAVFFRRPADLPPPSDVVAARPAVAWLQSGIRNPAWEAAVAAGGVRVVADRCIKVERARAKL